MNEQETYLNEAQRLDPSGAVCGWCGSPNTWADDIGFFYCTPEDNDTRPTCEACYQGEPGQKHIRRYGVGER